MTSKQLSDDLNKKLQLGIDAARTGNNGVAKEFLIAVLKQDPENIPAMLWLAFVLPSPQDTIRVLQRVLSLDPGNERAEAGIRWAKGRLGLDPDQPEIDEEVLESESEESAKTEPESADDIFIRQQLLSGKLQKQAKKGVLAHRARRTIKPLLIVIIIMSVLGLASIGVGALAFLPPDTLAAWLPPSAARFSFEPIRQPFEAAPPIQEPSPPPAVKPLSSGSDTLATEPSRLIEQSRIEPASSALPQETDLSPEAATLAPPAVTNLFSIEPFAFIGPELPNPIAPAENLPLAHEPAYPGEKWIEVNLTAQQVTAWEGDQPVFTFAASTGLPNTPTVTGEFHVYWKLESTLMTGPGYYLPEVPYTMYFYGGYGLHGTYWHNNFGQPMSHGCVNLETGNAKKLFEWADPPMPPGQTQVVAGANNPGTLVVVHQ